MFTYSISDQGTKAVVIYEGDLDIEATEMIEDQITPELLQHKDIEIDFSRVPFIDSSGIGLLISQVTSVRENGSQVVIINLNEEVQQVFEILQLPDILGDGVLKI